MSYQATVINVMIASPSDVPEGRNTIRDVIWDWNAVHAKSQKIVLFPVMWESHSVPDSGDRPQAIINKQLLRDADLLVALFWRRLGSPTGTALSGTAEEIQEHIKAGKSAMLYFFSDLGDAATFEPDQYAALMAFKKAQAANCLYQECKNTEEFRLTFTRQLASRVHDHFSSGLATNASALVPPAHDPPTLSREARELLIEASKDRDGSILCTSAMDGYRVQANNRMFSEAGNTRSEARWRDAVQELKRSGLIRNTGGRGELMILTSKGYELADALSASAPLAT